MTIIHDLHQVARLASGHLFRASVIEDQDIGALDLADDARETAIAARGSQLTEQARHAG